LRERRQHPRQNHNEYQLTPHFAQHMPPN
jgi:hypothetical protein